MFSTLTRSLTAAALVLGSIACGSGADDPPPPAGPALVGAAGGTVADVGGAQVVIPAGALVNDAAIAVIPSASGAPPLPQGVTALGPIIAFTPHGTAFALPATISVPFDPALLAAGEQPVLYKTDATQANWVAVPGATASGRALSAAVDGFSYAVVGRTAAVVEYERTRTYSFTEYTSLYADADITTSPGDAGIPPGDVYASKVFGVTAYAGWDVQRDGIAMGEAFGSADGTVFWVQAEAPHVGPVAELADLYKVRATAAHFTQDRKFRKLSDAATYELVITHADIDAYDGGPSGYHVCYQSHVTPEGELLITRTQFGLEALGEGVCLRDIDANVLMFVVATSSRTIFYTAWGTSTLTGMIGDWEHSAPESQRGEVALWTAGDFEFRPDYDGDGTGRHARVRLLAPKRVAIDLSSIATGEEFMVRSFVWVDVKDTKQLETYVGAYMRDPAGPGGVTEQTTGLEVVQTSQLVPLWGPQPGVPAHCVDQPIGGHLRFMRTSVTAREIAGPQGVDLQVMRLYGSSGPVSATLATSDGSARAGVDYLPRLSTLSWADGDMAPKRIAVPLIDDPAAEGDKTFNVTLSAPTGCAILGGNPTAVVTILDNTVRAPGSYTLGGTLSGLAGSGLVLEGPFGNLTPLADGPFTMPGTLLDGLPYTVRVGRQPSGPDQVCSVTNGSGVVAGANVTNVQVTCITPTPASGLDPSFGGTGKVAIGNPGGVGEAVAVQADGKIVLAGSGTGSFTVLRLLPGGALDPGFGTGGRVDTDFGNGDDAYDLAVQPDGRIVVVGRAQVNGVHDFAIARYEADGRLDTTFGSGGKLTVDFAGSADYAQAVVIQPDGKIVVGGQAGSAGANNFALTRLTASGSLDTSFGTGGKVLTPIAGNDARAYDLALAPDGKLVLAGLAHVGTTNQFAAARYTVTGQLDTSFGTQGIALVPVQSSAEAHGAQVLADGSVLLAGTSSAGLRSDLSVVKLTPLGLPDAGFGSAGKVSTNLSGSRDSGRALAVQADGRIVLAGHRTSATASDIAVLRFLANGAPDPSFGSGGALAVDHAGAGDQAGALALQADGRIVVGGHGVNGRSTEFIVLRVMP